MEPLNDDRGRTLLDATCRVALAGLLHDLGRLAERADMHVQDRELLEVALPQNMWVEAKE